MKREDNLETTSRVPCVCVWAKMHSAQGYKKAWVLSLGVDVSSRVTSHFAYFQIRN